MTKKEFQERLAKIRPYEIMPIESVEFCSSCKQDIDVRLINGPMHNEHIVISKGKQEIHLHDDPPKIGFVREPSFKDTLPIKSHTYCLLKGGIAVYMGARS